MIRALFKLLLKTTRSRGLNRLDRPLRRLAKPPVDRVGDLLMELDPFEGSQLDLMAGYVAETGTLALIRQLLKTGDTYIDVGAHVGLHALTAAKAVGPTGRVIAIDPQPYCCERLMINAALNGLSNILVVAAAASNRDGPVTLSNQARTDRTRLTLTGPGQADLVNRFETGAIRLDSLIERHDLTAIRLIKIDVEGYESEVIAGACGALAITDNVVLEHLPEASDGVGASITAALGALGFELRQIDGAPWTAGQRLLENNIWAVRR
ncbi:MAG: FkbM family methyltransferase [Alphaproteobacteria bacterium]